MTTSQRMTTAQLEALVSYMEKNGDLSAHTPEGAVHSIGTRYKLNNWIELVKMLNKLGMPRTLVKWRKTWTDWKFKTKMKVDKIHLARATDKEGPVKRLNDIEARIKTVMKYKPEIKPEKLHFELAQRDLTKGVPLMITSITSRVSDNFSEVFLDEDDEKTLAEHRNLISPAVNIKQEVSASGKSDMDASPSRSPSPERAPSPRRSRRKRFQTHSKMKESSPPTVKKQFKPQSDHYVPCKEWTEYLRERDRQETEREIRRSESERHWRKLFERYVTVLEKISDKFGKD